MPCAGIAGLRSGNGAFILSPGGCIRGRQRTRRSAFLVQAGPWRTLTGGRPHLARLSRDMRQPQNIVEASYLVVPGQGPGRRLRYVLVDVQRFDQLRCLVGNEGE